MDNKQILNHDVLDNFAPALAAMLDKLVIAGFNDIQLQLETLFKLGKDIDKVVMVRGAHSIKSCSAQLGGEALSYFALQKEQQYNSGKLDTLSDDLTVFTKMFDDLKSEMESALAVRGFH